MKKSGLYLALISLVVDVVVLVIALMLAYGIRSGGIEIYFWPYTKYLSFVLWVVPLWILIFATQGLYNPRNLPKGWNAFMKIVVGLISGWGALLIFLYMWRSPEAQVFPRLAIVYGVGLTTVFTLIGRLFIGAISSFLKNQGVGLINTVVVGSGSSSIAKTIKSSTVHGRNLVAEISLSGAVSKLSQLYKIAKFNEVILADSKANEEKLLPVIEWADNAGCSVTLVPSVLAVRSTNVEVNSLAGTPVLFFRRTPLEGWGLVYKRIFDLVISLLLIIVLSPVFVVVGLMVLLTSQGPLIFKQERVGHGDKKVFVYKFRSMYADADNRFKKYKGWSTNESKDPRITPIGRFIRKTNLDELPQLFNILRGTMSVVGPRPEQPKYVNKFSKEIPNYIKRHHVKTGLTGWAQINGLRGDTSIPERVKYDLYYIEHWSIWFDIRIILSTILVGIRQLSSNKS